MSFFFGLLTGLGLVAILLAVALWWLDRRADTRIREWETRYLALDDRYRATVDSQAATMLQVARQMAGWRDPNVEPAAVRVADASSEEIALRRATDQRREQIAAGLRTKFDAAGMIPDEAELDHMVTDLMAQMDGAVR